MPFWNACARNLKIKCFLISAFLLVCLPTKISRGCGPVNINFRGYSFIDPVLLNLAMDRAPFFIPFKELYDDYKGAKAEQQLGNIEEWRERFCDIPKLTDIHQLIYKSTLTDLQVIRSSIGKRTGSLPYSWETNTFAKHLQNEGCLEVIDYLIYAKRCEPHVLPQDTWDPAPRNVVAMRTLIDQAKQFFIDIESHYVRLRYAYQMVRLSHYAGDYEETLELYDWLMPKIDNDPSILEYWILGHKAGALMKLGRNVEAGYLYAQIYDRCPSKRTSAFRSFLIKTDDEWHECMLLCKDDRERATLHVLRANQSKSNITEELNNIYELDPKNDQLELLLVREIQKLEKDLLGIEFNDQKQHNKRYQDIPRPIAGQVVIDLLAFVRKMLEEKQVANLELWKMAEFYLEFLAGNNYYAQRTLEEAKDFVKNKKLKAQLNVWELAFEIATFEGKNGKLDELEENIGTLKRRNRTYEQFPDFEDYTNDKLAQLYREYNHPGKAFRIHYPLRAMLPNPQPAIIEDLIAVCNQTTRNYIEREMVERGDSTIKNDLLDIKATLALQKYQLEAALEIYKDIGRADWDNYGLFAPFIERVKDCVHCPLPDTARLYNKGELIETIRKKEYDARAYTKNSAWLFYEIGLAYYNISYFGHSWRATDYFRSGSSLSRWQLTDNKNFVMDHYYYPFGNRENLDSSQALLYFERALELAETGGNRELAARAAFMAAKCELNNFYINRFNGGVRTYKFFNMLAGEYWNTAFVQNRVLKECKYFEAYVN